MSRSRHPRPRRLGLASDGIRYANASGQPVGTPFVTDVEKGIPDAQHPAVHATHDPACMHNHRGAALGRAKWKRRLARKARRASQSLIME